MTHSNIWPTNEWALKHLNWAWILYPVLLYIPLLIIAIIFQPNDTLLIILACLYIGFHIYLSVWNLKHKGRRLWNLLYLIMPFGEIIFLCISNKEQLETKSNE